MYLWVYSGQFTYAKIFLADADAAFVEKKTVGQDTGRCVSYNTTLHVQIVNASTIPQK